MVEKSSYHLESYNFSRPVIVLSSMYLVVRAHLEQEKEKIPDHKVFAKYVEHLSKSTNLIFYDHLGIN